MSEQEIITDPLDDLGVDRWHPFRADCVAIQDHCRHRRYDEAGEHMLRLKLRTKPARSGPIGLDRADHVARVARLARLIAGELAGVELDP
jgi:hypothetical protein